MTLLSRDDIARALSMLASELNARGVSANIQIVGGAALALRHFDRSATRDIDSSIRFADAAVFHEAALRVANRLGWDGEWINDEAAKYIPRVGEAVHWETIHEHDGVLIQVASAESLLAMKLLANRPGRDDRDIAELMAICDLSTVAELEELFERFYPGDGLSDRAIAIVERIRSVGIPNKPSPPPFPALP